MAATYATGTLTLNDLTAAQDVRDVDPKLFQVYASEYSFLTFMDSIAQTRHVKNVKFEHMFQDRLPRATAIVSVSGNVLTVTTGTGQYFSANDVILNVTQDEQMYVVSVSGDAITVDDAQSATASDALRRTNKTVKDGGSVSDDVYVLPENYYNYVQQMDASLELSWLTVESALQAEPSPEKTRLQEKIKQFARDKNAALLFNKRDKNTNDGVRYIMGGAKYQISTTKDMTSVTEEAFREWLGGVSQYGGHKKVLVGGPKLMAKFDSWGIPDRQLRNDDLSKTLGLEIQKYRNPYFELNLMLDYTFVDCGYESTALLLDMETLRNVIMIPYKILRNVQANDSYTRKHALYNVAGIEITNEKRCAILTNL